VVPLRLGLHLGLGLASLVLGLRWVMTHWVKQGGIVARTSIAATVGGTASEIGGGKFMVL